MEDKFGRIVVACPHCGQKLRSEPGAIGTCPKCNTKLEFPMSVSYGPQTEQNVEKVEAPPPPKKKSKAPIIIVVLVLLLALGGAAFWYFVLRDKGGEADKPAADAAAAMVYQDFGVAE